MSAAPFGTPRPPHTVRFHEAQLQYIAAWLHGVSCKKGLEGKAVNGVCPCGFSMGKNTEPEYEGWIHRAEEMITRYGAPHLYSLIKDIAHLQQITGLGLPPNHMRDRKPDFEDLR